MRRVEPWLTLPAILFGVLYASVSSENFLRFHNVRIADGNIYKVREVPYGTVTAEWTEKIVTPEGRVCPPSGSSGRSTYEDRRALAGDIEEVHYSLGEMAKCVVPQAIYSSKHTVILGDWLPLRPVYFVHVIE
jgi:hypothetical protein